MLEVPAPTHGFVGRDRELERIDTLLRGGSVRLITLVGPGGIGKTRLAAEAVRRFTIRAGGGARVYWVRLAARLKAGSDYGAVERETASAVVGVDFPQRSAWKALVDTLHATTSSGQHRRAIVVLDNCEHVLAEVRRLVADLLETLPELTIVATGRGAIGWIDEYSISVPPLPKEQALTLFGQQAELIGHRLDADRKMIAAEICRHVHNHPLYIRLAATRLRHRPAAVIRDELTGRADDKRLSWPGGLGTDPRHHVVNKVIAWSYDLSNARQRLLFDRLSVFAPGSDTHPADRDNSADMGADLDAITAICGDDDTIDDGRAMLPRHEISALLEQLTDQCMVTVHLTTTRVGYSLVETLRVFAAQQLRKREPDEPARLAARHLRYYRDKVADAAARWFSPAEQQLVDWTRAAWDNILAAIETSLTDGGDAAAGLQICLGLIALRVPFVRGSMRDLKRWTQRCLAATMTTPRFTQLQVKVQAAMCWFAVRQGHSMEANRMLDDCVAKCLSGDHVANWRGHPEIDHGLPVLLDLAWGTELFMAERDPRAVTVLVRARDKAQAHGDAGSAMMAGMFAGLAAGLLATPQQAHDIAGKCLEQARASGALWAASWAELSWAVSRIKAGDSIEAANVLRHALTHQLAVRDQWGAAWSIELLTWALAHTLSRTTDHTTATQLATEIAHLAGGVKTLRARLGINIDGMGTFADQSRMATGIARKALGDSVYTTAEARGAELRPDIDEVHRLALRTLAVKPLAAAIPWYTLTRVERDVALLAAAGYTNAEIAVRRGRSTRTIDNQISSILTKLDITSRNNIVEKTPNKMMSQIEKMETQRQHRHPRRT